MFAFLHVFLNCGRLVFVLVFCAHFSVVV